MAEAREQAQKQNRSENPDLERPEQDLSPEEAEAARGGSRHTGGANVLNPDDTLL